MNRKKIRKIILSEVESILEDSLYGMGSKLIIDKGLRRCEINSDILAEFCIFCKKFLKIKEPITIEIVENRKNSGITTTAFYNPNNHMIKIYGKNRAIVDICRSIGHEMTHMSQMIENRIKFPVQDAGGDIEDEANAKAGEMIKIFAKSKPERKRIYESLIYSTV